MLGASIFYKNKPQILMDEKYTLWRKFLLVGLVAIIIIVISINLLVSLI
jgi:hypothetical protein